MHIKVLKLKVVLFGLKSLCRHYRQTHTKVLSDNTTTVCAINNSWSDNAFCVSWHNLSFYSFPPFLCIRKVLQKIISDNSTDILIIPNWPSQFWFTVLQGLLLTEVFSIPPNANDLYLPNQPDLVSGKAFSSSTTYPVVS